MNPPVANRVVMLSVMDWPTQSCEISPDTLTSEITISEVPTARDIDMLLNNIKAGTMMNPPPTPNMPERIPEATPTISSKRAHRPVRINCPAASL